VLEVIVYADHGRSVAIVVEEILDIVDGEAAIRSDIDDLGLLGSAVLGDKVTELLDVRAAILAADPAFYNAPAIPPRRRPPASPPLCWRSDRDRPTDIKASATSGQLGHLPAGRRPVRHRGRARAGGAAQPAAHARAARPDGVAGLINLRGQVVTAIELRERLGRRRGPRAPTPSSSSSAARRGRSACSSTRSPTSSTSTRATSRRRRTRSRARPVT
jgi:hypothetical protein